MEHADQKQEIEIRKGGWELKPEMVIGFIGAVILIVFFVFVAIAGSKSSSNITTSNQPLSSTETQTSDSPAPSAAPTPDNSNLNVTIHAYNYSNGVEIINNDDIDLTDCTLAINGQGFSLGYTYHDPLIDKKADTTIPFGWFTKDDETRFNIDTTALKGFYISCKENGQLKSAYFQGNQ